MNRVSAFLRLAVITLLAAQAQPRGDLRFEKSVEYQGSPLNQLLDVTLPPGQGLHPGVILLHAGDFASGSRADVDTKSQALARLGFVVFAPDYRMAARQQFPSPVHDVKAAVRWVRSNAARYQVDPDRIGILGYGAGGYLAIMAGITQPFRTWEGIGPNQERSSQVTCAVSAGDWPGFSAAGGFASLGTIPSFLGGTSAADPESYLRAYPATWASPESARLVFVGPGEWAAPLQARLSEKGAVSEIVPDAAQDFAAISACLNTKAPQYVLVADHGPGGSVVIMDWPSGALRWRIANSHGHDAQALPNGSVLITLDAEGRVAEYDREKRLVWQYGPGEELGTVISAQRLQNGNTLVADTTKGIIQEVTPDRQVVWSYTSPDLAGNRMRVCRRTAAGTTLISIEGASRIVEVNRDGDVIWSYEVRKPGPRRPYQALRLPSGNTLISLTDPGELVEVSPDGTTVRSIGGEGGRIRMGWTSGFDVMPNGNLLIADYSGQRLIEVDRAGNLVHQLRVPYRPATIQFIQQP